jgi:hypothetical protein
MKFGIRDLHIMLFSLCKFHASETGKVVLYGILSVKNAFVNSVQYVTEYTVCSHFDLSIRRYVLYLRLFTPEARIRSRGSLWDVRWTN